MNSAAERAEMNPAEIANIARTEETLWWYRGMRSILDAFLDGLPMPAGGLLLEAGCGTGFNSSVFQRQRQWRMCPLDLEWAGLRHGQAMGLERLCQGDLAALPFAGASFSAVFSLDVIVHFPRGQEGVAFAELARVLAPGGLLLVRVSALDILRSRHSIHASEKQRFTAGRLRECVQAAGLQVLRCTYANSFLLPVALAKFRLWEPLTNAPPASGVAPVARWLDRLLHAPLAWEAGLIGSGVNFPLGQSLLIAAQKPGGSPPGSK